MSLEIFQYRLPFNWPFRQQDYREGLLLVRYSPEGEMYLGEIAPFPGLHRESLKDATQQLFQITSSPSIPTTPLFPSVQWGLAMLEIPFVSDEISMPVPINGLLAGNMSEIIRTGERLVAQGYTTLKIKVGRNPLEEDVMAIKTLRSIVGKNILFRLDGNRLMSLEKALTFCERVHPFQIAYLEEPVPLPLLAPFAQASPIPLALDEALWELSPATWQSIPAAAYILKPTCIGDFQRLNQVMDYAHQQGRQCIWASAFESSVNISFMAQQISKSPFAALAHGLGTLNWLGADVFTPPLRIFRGKLFPIDKKNTLNKVYLKKIA